MVCQAGCDPWRTTSRPQLPDLSQPQATVWAMGSLGMGLARSCALTAVRHLLAKGLRRTEQTVRQPRRAWDDDTPRKWGAKRQALHVETGCAPLRGGMVRGWQGTPRAWALEAPTLGARFVGWALSVV